MRCPRRLAPLFAALLLSLPAGCDQGADVADDGSDEVAEASSSIIAGAVDEAHPAVVALTLDGKAFCSGTLIAPTIVVTAAHCLHEDHVGVLPMSQVRVFFGTDVDGAGTFVEVAETHLHPDFRSDDPEQDDDVAMVRLAVEAPVAPMAIGGAPDEGRSLTLVGFGRSEEGVSETGVKRSGTSKVRQITPRLFVMQQKGQGTCKGDSGGAAIATVAGVDVFVGVHTRSDCRTGSIEERVDAHLASFIEPFVGAPLAVTELSGDDVQRVDEDAADADESAETDALAPSVDGPSAGCSIGAAHRGGAAPALLALVAGAIAARRRRRG